MKPPFHLIPKRVSADTVIALEQMLAEARAGELIGVAYAAMYRERKYVADTAGECRRNPSFACGIVTVLGVKLAHAAEGR